MLDTFLPHKPITGKLIEASGLTLICPVCGVKHTNIRNGLIPLPLEKDHPERRLFTVNGIHLDDICECLFNSLCEYVHSTGQLPIIQLYPDSSINN